MVDIEASCSSDSDEDSEKEEDDEHALQLLRQELINDNVPIQDPMTGVGAANRQLDERDEEERKRQHEHHCAQNCNNKRLHSELAQEVKEQERRARLAKKQKKCMNAFFQSGASAAQDDNDNLSDFIAPEDSDEELK